MKMIRVLTATPASPANPLVVAKGNTSLATAINKALSELHADGPYATLSHKFLKEKIGCHH